MHRISWGGMLIKLLHIIVTQLIVIIKHFSSCIVCHIVKKAGVGNVIEGSRGVF